MKWKIGIPAILAVVLAAFLFARKSNSEVALLNCDDVLVRDLAFSTDGRMLVGTGESGIATAWSLPGFAKVWSSDCGAKLRSLAILDSKGWIAVACDDAELHLLDAASGTEVRKLKLPAKAARLAAAPDGNRVAVGTLDGRIIVYDFSTTAEPRSWKPGGKHIHGLCFSPDSKTLVSGDDKGNLQSWDATTGKPLNGVSLGRQHIHDIQIAGEPARIAVAMAGKGVLIGALADPPAFFDGINLPNRSFRYPLWLSSSCR